MSNKSYFSEISSSLESNFLKEFVTFLWISLQRLGAKSARFKADQVSVWENRKALAYCQMKCLERKLSWKGNSGRAAPDTPSAGSWSASPTRPPPAPRTTGDAEMAPNQRETRALASPGSRLLAHMLVEWNGSVWCQERGRGKEEKDGRGEREREGRGEREGEWRERGRERTVGTDIHARSLLSHIYSQQSWGREWK